MNKILVLLASILIFSGCQSLSEPDNLDLNWYFAPMYARQLKTKSEDPKVYFNIVRLKIYTRATKIYRTNKNLKDEGTVFVEFSLNGNGEVERVEIIEQDSTESKALREIALEAVLKSSPFPRFYKTMGQKVINYNMEIDFAHEMEKKQICNK
jgi:TonB family protein